MGACDTPGSAMGVHVAGSYAYVAGKDSGLQVIERFSPLADISYIDSGTFTATVPAGYRPGTYNLYVTNPDGGHEVLHNAFTIYTIEPPVPLINIDGQKEVNILPGTPAVISLGLDPGDHEGEPAGVFIWLETPTGRTLNLLPLLIDIKFAFLCSEKRIKRRYHLGSGHKYFISIL